MKKRVFSFIMALLLILAQMSTTFKFGVHAADPDFSVEVVVQTPQGVMVRGNSSKSNALDALSEVLVKNNITPPPAGTSFINDINGYINNDKNNGCWWMYTVNTGEAYDSTADTLSINQYTLHNGNRLVVYYSNFSDSMIPINKITYSNKFPDSDLVIKFENESWMGSVPIVNISVKIDGKVYEMNKYEVKINSGLSEGMHTLELTNTSSSKVKIVEDSFKFELKYPTVRVEGLNDTIVEGKANGSNAFDIAEKVLKANNIEYGIKKYDFGTMITSVAGLSSFNGVGGWNYYIKSGKKVITPDVSMDNYKVQPGDNIILYMTDWNVPYVNKVSFTPNVVKSNESFKMKFINVDYASKEKGIISARVTIDGLNYITDETGEIQVPGLALGTHSYKISGYNGEQPSNVVMDKGIFVIDDVNSPSFDYSDGSYNESDNKEIVKDVDKSIGELTQYFNNAQCDEWSMVSMKKLGIVPKDTFIAKAAKDIDKYGVEDYSNPDLEKLVIGLTASGYSPYKFQGYDLVHELYERDLNDFLVNDVIFAIVAYNYANVENKYTITEDALVSKLLSMEVSEKLDNGTEISGWALSGNTPNPDITGIAINALSKFYDRQDVKSRVDKAVTSLVKTQNDSGYMSDNFGIFSESQSFVILGLTSIGINPEGVLFTKNKGDLVSALLSFRNSDGQFKHSLSGQDDYMATEQALRALIAIKEFKSTGKYNFFSNNVKAESLEEFKYLPKTGELADFRFIILSGLTLIATGFVLTLKGKN